MPNTSKPTGTYDKPFTMSYSLGRQDMAAAGEVLSIKGPAGMRGILREISASVVETFNAVTTSAFVRVGTSADNDAYAELTMGTTADTDTLNMTEQTGALKDADIAADEQVEVVLVANTGGTPAGIAYITIVVEWY